MKSSHTFTHNIYPGHNDQLVPRFKTYDWTTNVKKVFQFNDIPVELLDSEPVNSFETSSEFNDADLNATKLKQPELNQDYESDHYNQLQETLKCKFEEGYKSGYSAGESQTKKVIEEQILTSHNNIIQSLMNNIHTQLNIISENKVNQQFEAFKRMALGLATEIAKVEISINPKVLDHLVKTCLEALDADNQTITIEAHPNDLALLQNNGLSEEFHQIVWIEDMGLQPGSIRAYTDHAAVEDLLQQRLSTLTHELLRNEGNSHD